MVKVVQETGMALAVACGLLAAGAVKPTNAYAFSLFGLIGAEEPPPANAETLPYTLTFETGGVDDVGEVIEDASNLQRLQAEPPPNGHALVLRARSDIDRLIEALWGAGYYAADVEILIGGQWLFAGQGDVSSAVAVAENYRARDRVPVTVVATPGAQFRFRTIRVIDAATSQPFAPNELPTHIIKLEAGEPARASDILAAEARIIDHFRSAGQPFAKVVSREPVAFHQSAVMDVTLVISRGPTAGVGEIAVSGTQDVDPAVVRSHIYTDTGTLYSPKEMRGIKTSIGRVEAISSVRIREGTELDARGNLPISVEVTERKPRLIGASAEFSTTDGPALSAYWAHRNLFGGAERLRIDGSIFFAQRGNDDGLPDFDSFDWEDIGGRLSASFVKPALKGSRNDLLLDATASREATEGYLASFGNVSAALRHRWTDSFSAQIGPEFEIGESEDALSDLQGGPLDYTLFGLQAALIYDSTDSPLDPTEGVRAIGSVGSYFDTFDNSISMTTAQVKASTYYALDEEGRYVLAGRVGFGSLVGSDLEDVPANRRFFAGGGGSVRGYKYRSLGPDLDGEPIGGLSLLEASLEARVRMTDTIGLVPFIDAGTAFDDSLPDFQEEIKIAAGLGLRYYSAIGPIRLDVAVPINPDRDDPDYAVYIGIGQAF